MASSPPLPLAAQLAAALAALHAAGSSPAQRAQADAWLLSFQSAAESWAACLDELEAGPPPHVALFLAQTLRRKARTQLAAQLPREHWPALCGRLAALARTAAAATDGITTGPVLQALCLALAQLTLAVDERRTAVANVTAALGSDGAALVYMLALADEAFGDVSSSSASGAPHRASAPWPPAPAPALGTALARRAELAALAPEVLAWLRQLMPAPSGGGGGAAAGGAPAVLRCFAAWARLGALDGGASDDALALADAALRSLVAGSGGDAEAAAACLQECLEYAPPALLSALAPRMLPLPAAAAAAFDAGGGPGRAALLCRVFASYAASRAEKLLSADAEGAGLREGLLALASTPAAGEEEPLCLPAWQAWCGVAELAAADRLSPDGDGGGGGSARRHGHHHGHSAGGGSGGGGGGRPSAARGSRLDEPEAAELLLRLQRAVLSCLAAWSASPSAAGGASEEAALSLAPTLLDHIAYVAGPEAYAVAVADFAFGGEGGGGGGGAEARGRLHAALTAAACLHARGGTPPAKLFACGDALCRLLRGAAASIVAAAATGGAGGRSTALSDAALPEFCRAVSAGAHLALRAAQRHVSGGELYDALFAACRAGEGGGARAALAPCGQCVWGHTRFCRPGPGA